jgi:hypothetical protein
LESGVPADDEPIIGAGYPLTVSNYGTRKLKPAVKVTVGRAEGVTPYLLRHTHASLLHYCGFTVPSAAARGPRGHGALEHLRARGQGVGGPAAPRRPRRLDRRRARADLAFPSRSRRVAESGDLQG